MSHRQDIPQDEDVDDLDDVLQDFDKPLPSRQPTKPVPPAPSNGLPSSSGQGNGGDEGEGDDEEQFLKELQREMEDMFAKMLEEEVPASSQEREKDKDDIFASSKAGQKSFQEAIQETMDKLKSSDANVSDQLGSMDELLSGLEGLGDGSIDEIMYSMMEGMISKELLYDGFKELSQKYTEYLSKKPNAPQTDLDRYILQQELIESILQAFDHPKWFDEDVLDSTLDGPSTSTSTTVKPVVRTEKEVEEQRLRKKEVVKLVTKMHEYGAPPKEIVAEGEGMPQIPGLPSMPGLDKDCVIS